MINMNLFVYGTLMKGFHNNHLLKDALLIGSTETMDEYALYANIIPYVSAHKKVSRIKGELYSITLNHLKNTDRLEGHPQWYRRHDILLANNEMAFMYIMPSELIPRDATLIEDGDYKRYIKEEHHGLLRYKY